MRYCKHCDTEIPAARLKLLPHTQFCVKCSDEEKWSAVHVIHHKTGNEIEVVKNADTAKQFKKMSTRSTYGAIRGLNSKGSMNIFKGPGLVEFASEEKFNKIRERAIELYELCGEVRATKYITEFVNLRVLSEGQGKRILKELTQPVVVVEEVTKPNKKYNPYGKAEPKKQKPVVSDDIMYVFHNWKR